MHRANLTCQRQPKMSHLNGPSTVGDARRMHMVFALDTLGYAKHLEAARDFIMAELVTKIDLEAALDRVTLRMTVRFGVMLVAGIGVLAALQKLS